MIRKLSGIFAPLHRAAALVTLTVSLALAAPAAASERDPAAEAFVDQLASQAINILSEKQYSPSDREAAFRVLFVGNMDLPRIGMFALGQYARTPTPEQRREYLGLVEDFIVKVYASRLANYTNQKFTILNSQPKGKKGREVIVSSQIEFADGSGEPVPVEWWLLKTDDGFKVFDVNVVGIWMAQEQRSAFISVIRNNNGNFDALIQHIEARIGEETNEIDSRLTNAEPGNGS